jgi:UDPglucose--hexose-1-phosphate uridylyltransferase
MRVGSAQSWSVRVVPNRYPILGPHEVVVETPEHGANLARYTRAHTEVLLGVYEQRIAALEGREGVRWVQVFRNQGMPAGASLGHPHTQIIGLDRMPGPVAERAAASREGECVFCRLAADEGRGERGVYRNDSFSLFVPYAPRYEYELWLVANHHLPSLAALDPTARAHLADCLRTGAALVDRVSVAYNLMLFYGFAGGDFHLHLELIPRFARAVRAGLELSTGYSVLSRTPEEMAAVFREMVDSLRAGLA